MGSRIQQTFQLVTDLQSSLKAIYAVRADLLGTPLSCETDLRRIKREVKKEPLQTSFAIVANCGLPDVPCSTICSVLREVSKMKKA